MINIWDIDEGWKPKMQDGGSADDNSDNSQNEDNSDDDSSDDGDNADSKSDDNSNDSSDDNDDNSGSQDGDGAQDDDNSDDNSSSQDNAAFDVPDNIYPQIPLMKDDDVGAFDIRDELSDRPDLQEEYDKYFTAQMGEFDKAIGEINNQILQNNNMLHNLKNYADRGFSNDAFNPYGDSYSIGVVNRDISAITTDMGGRNNNPTNITINSDNAKWLNDRYGAIYGEPVKTTDGWSYEAHFPNVAAGVQAAKDLLESRSYRNLSVHDAMERWVGDDAYSNQLAQKFGNRKIAQLSDDQVNNLIMNMIRNEVSSDTYQKIQKYAVKNES